MSAPTLDRNPRTSTQAGASTGRRRSRRPLVLAASALVVLAVAVGTSLAIATRPEAPQAATDPGAVAVGAANGQNDQNANADQGTTAQPGQDTQAAAGTKSQSDSDSKSDSSGSTGATPALQDGIHPAYITRVDRANDRIVVDVVQVFQGDKAVEAAVADGKPRSQAQYLATYVRNENPRLRTLPLASGLVVKLWASCEENASGHNLLTTLSANASQKGTYYYDLTISHGKVQRIQEQLAINAC
jgi:hypothetical protein